MRGGEVMDEDGAPIKTPPGGHRLGEGGGRR